MLSTSCYCGNNWTPSCTVTNIKLLKRYTWLTYNSRKFRHPTLHSGSTLTPHPTLRLNKIFLKNWRVQNIYKRPKTTILGKLFIYIALTFYPNVLLIPEMGFKLFLPVMKLKRPLYIRLIRHFLLPSTTLASLSTWSIIISATLSMQYSKNLFGAYER